MAKKDGAIEVGPGPHPAPDLTIVAGPGLRDLLAGVVGGMLTTLATGAAVDVADPGLLPWLAGLVIVVGAFVLAWNVVEARLRPWLNRLADGVQVVALMAVLPLTVWILGLA